MSAISSTWWFKGIRIAAIVYGVYLLALFLLQRWMIFPHFRRTNPTIASRVSGLVRMTISIPEGTVEAWFLPGVGVDAAHPGPAVIFAHGNGELIEDWAFTLQSYRDLGVSVLLPEFRGYGDSAGEPTQETLTSDFVRFYDLLVARPDVDRSRIIIHGRSIGGGVACALAAQRKPVALVLQSTFANLGRLAHQRFAPAFLLLDKFDNESVVKSLDVPVFIAHGRKDSIISYDNGVSLAAAAKHGTFVSYDTDHNDTPPDWEAFMKSVAEFLRGAGVLKAAAAH